MKTINEPFTDKEHKLLKKAKKDNNWHDFILDCAKKQIEEDISSDLK